jgi:hypothetical protein
VLYLQAAVDTGWFGSDFRASLWDPAKDMLAGVSPYPEPSAGNLTGNPFLYPPVIFLFGAPATLLPLALAEIGWTLLLAAAIAGTCWVLGVRDRRCYGIALLSLPTLDGLAVGNITFLLIFGVALLWRYRDRPYLVALVAGAVIALKPFLWPLLLWLALTSRWRALGGAAVTCAIVVVVPWAAIGFAGLADYPQLLSEFSKVVRTESLSIYALATGLGLPGELGSWAQYAAGGALIGAAGVLRRKDDHDRRVFAALIIAALVLSPIVWRHYFALLIVPIALWHPRMRPAWLIPMGFWLALLLPGIASPDRDDVYQRAPADVALALALVGMAFVATATARSRGRLPASLVPPVAARDTG